MKFFPSKANFEPLSPISFLVRAAIVFKDHLAIVDKDQIKTYKQFYDDCLALSRNFTKLGVKKGDKIAYICLNNYELLIGHFAVPLAGGVLVAINHRLSQNEITYILRHATVKLLIAEEKFMCNAYKDMVKKRVLIGCSTGCLEPDYDYLTLDKQLKDVKIDRFESKINEKNLITINYTSGTTDNPKGVMYTHRSTYINSLGECITVGLNYQSRFLWVLPMFHCNGWCFTWAVSAVGATNYFPESYNADGIIMAIMEYKITHFCAAPAVLIQLQQSSKFDNLKSINGLTIITAGSAPSPTLIKEYLNFGIRIIHVYGLTETHGPHTTCKIESNLQNNESAAIIISKQGFPSLQGNFVKVITTDNKEVPHDGITIGEVLLRGNNIMEGYYKNTRLTRKVFKNGWFHTGDLAVISPDGSLEIKDRLKDIIISGGENISSIEIENILYQHPYVLSVAVIPKQDPKWGEVPKAIVELKKGKTISEAELIDFCRNRLSHFKCPKEVVFETIPKTNTGKVKKNELRNIYSK